MPGPGEPLWLDEDRDWALALLHVEADQCPDCGSPWGEATAQENEYAYASDLTQCHACAESARAVRAFQEAGGDTAGLHVHTHRR
ncbi:hypothetical protein [Streptomyces sp. UH6]|uniref:hypothetical protein n=1 Tax=Streptomyces sp. UH6 TaxID=2748379 RepID=UPI0015D49573|nr:hypothetical protein [Streptomyces sp. UH6]NYV73180.1 hypothetical protein [Streptomyces sp. UH6]